MSIERLLDYVVCPRCRGPLRLDDGRQWLVCETDRLAYPVQDGIACLTSDAARPLDQDPPVVSSTK